MPTPELEKHSIESLRKNWKSIMSRLINDGQEFLILRYNEPMARLVPVDARGNMREPRKNAKKVSA